jgi:hypothetical protein
METRERAPTAVTLAKLKVAPAQVVYDALRDLQVAAKTSLNSFGSTDADALEKVLVERKVPLIDLGVAAHGCSRKVVPELFRTAGAPTNTHDADVAHGIRVACLANVLEPMSIYLGTPGGLGMAELTEVLMSGTDDECSALLQNPAAGKVLAMLFMRAAPLDTMPDGRYVHLVERSVGSPRINRDDSSVDGPDMQGWDIWKGILNLLATAPVDARWLNVLHSMLIRLNPAQVHGVTGDGIAQTLERWKPLRLVQSSRDAAEREGYYTHLSLVDEFRCLIASIFGRWYDKSSPDGFKFAGSMDSDDVALRCAYYGSAPAKTLAGAAWDTAAAKDSSAFTFAVLFNDNVYLDRALRAKLEDSLDSGRQLIYGNRCAQIAEKYRWFNARPISELPADEPAQLPSTPEALAAALARVEADLQQVKSKTGSLANTPTWVFVVAIVLLLYIATRH